MALGLFAIYAWLAWFHPHLPVRPLLTSPLFLLFLLLGVRELWCERREWLRFSARFTSLATLLFCSVLCYRAVALLDSLERLFSRAEDFVVTGAHASAAEAMMSVDWCDVDVLLTDLEMPGMSGAGLISAAVNRNPSLLAVAYTIHEHRENLFAALSAGASGYIIKGSTALELVDSLRGLVKGHVPISPSMASHLIQQFRASTPQDESADLSKRESELLQQLAAGKIYKEIADSLGISQHTVHNHVKNIYAKLHAKNRTEAVKRAQSLGYLDH